MIRSSACLAADDVSIRCRVRRSPFATNPQFGEAREMTCTMRNWHPTHHHYSTNSSAAPMMMGNDISNNSNINDSSINSSRGGDNGRSSSRSRRGGMPPYLKQRNTKTNRGGDSYNTGPELLMTPIHDILTNRNASPLRTKPPIVRKRTKLTNNCSNPADEQHESSILHQDYHYTNATTAEDNNVTTLASFSIPLHDIVVVESKKQSAQHYPHHVYSSSRGGGRRNRHHHHLQQQVHKLLLITTMENGYLEFNCATSNGHDVLYAFFQASIPPERIVAVADHHDAAGSAAEEENRSLPSKASSSYSCMDVDRLTAQQIQGAELSETWPQRFSRRVGKVVHTLTEVSESLCDMANCCRENSGNNHGTCCASATASGVPGGGGNNSSHTHCHHVTSTTESRDMPPSTAMPSSSTRSHQSAAAGGGHGGTTTTLGGCLEMVDDDVASLQSSFHSGVETLSRHYYHANNNTDNHESSTELLADHLQTNNNKCSSASAAAATIRQSCRVPSLVAGGLSFEQPDPVCLETMYHTN